MENMTKLTNEDNVQAEMANHDKHYWALVQGLKRKRKGWGELADMIGEGSTVAKAIWDKYVDFDFTKRMAEGAAGEAVTQAIRLVAEWKEYLERIVFYVNNSVGSEESDAFLVNVLCPAAKKSLKALEAIAESGSASTAGPRPNGPCCPKCSDVYCKRVTIRKVPGDIIHYRDDGWTEGVECLGCRHRGLKVEFFAAAPAEDAKEPEIPQCAVCQAPMITVGSAWTTTCGHQPMKKISEGIYSSETKPRKVDDARIKEILNRGPKPEDVQLDVEGLAHSILASLHKYNLSIMNSETLAEVEENLADLLRESALLRRVSGKGASVHELLKDALAAPVPATPSLQKIAAELFGWMDDLGINLEYTTPTDIALFLSRYNLATTQGTPEGANEKR